MWQKKVERRQAQEGLHVLLITGSEVEGVTAKDQREASGSMYGLWLTASKERGVSVLRSHKTEFGQQPK